MRAEPDHVRPDGCSETCRRLRLHSPAAHASRCSLSLDRASHDAHESPRVPSSHRGLLRAGRAMHARSSCFSRAGDSRQPARRGRTEVCGLPVMSIESRAKCRTRRSPMSPGRLIAAQASSATASSAPDSDGARRSRQKTRRASGEFPFLGKMTSALPTFGSRLPSQRQAYLWETKAAPARAHAA